MSNTLPALEEIEESFTFLDEWEERYAYLLDLAKKMQPLPDNYKTDDYFVPGCVSRVWMVPELDGDKLFFQADSDAILVRGLIAILVASYNGKTREQIAGFDIEAAFKRMGLEGHLSPNRRNGFFSLVGRIRQLAGA